MAVDQKEVKHIANLSRLKFTDQEEKEFLKQFNRILQQVDFIERIDTKEMLNHAKDCGTSNVLRKDIAHVCMSAEELLQNAPEKQDNTYLVPKVVD